MTGVLLLGGCDRSGAAVERDVPASLTRPQSVTLDSAGKLPPLPEPFDSGGCSLTRAVYRPHPGGPTLQNPELQYALRFDPDPEASWRHWAVFEAFDRRTGALLTRLRLQHVWSNGLSQEYVVSSREAVNAHMHHLNRDLSSGSVGANAPWLAPYAVLFSDLALPLYKLGDDWATLAPDVTFFTPEKVKPLFPETWLLSLCR
jgi:hypothetical protein